MKILLAEDDWISRKVIYKILEQYGECDITVDGMEAIDAFLLAQRENAPYDLICLDIMMPKIDGIRVLQMIRNSENEKNILPEKRSKIIMTTALSDKEYVEKAFEIGCEAYAAKPLDAEKLKEVLKKIGLLK